MQEAKLDIKLLLLLSNVVQVENGLLRCWWKEFIYWFWRKGNRKLLKLSNHVSTSLLLTHCFNAPNTIDDSLFGCSFSGKKMSIATLTEKIHWWLAGKWSWLSSEIATACTIWLFWPIRTLTKNKLDKFSIERSFSGCHVLFITL